MRIVHLIYDDPKNPWVGGGGAIRTATINELLAQRHEVTVLTGSFPGAQVDEVVGGVRYLRLGTSRNYFLSRLTFSLAAGLRARSLPHDLLVEDFSGHSPTFSPWFTPRPTVAVLQNFFGTNSFRKLAIAGLIPYAYEQLMVRRFDRLVTVSKAVLEGWVGPNFPRPTAVIPQGIDLKRFVPGPAAEEYLLYVGRLDFVQKGLDVLLQSIALNRDLRIPLVMVGGGDSERLRSMIDTYGVRDLVRHVGHVPHEEMVEHYRRAYCLCLPSRYEGWPLVCLESFAMGKPVVCTDIAGFGDVVKDGRTGVKARVGDAADFAAAIRKLISDSSLRARLGREAREVSLGYTWDKLAARQNAFYEEAVAYG